MKGGRRAATQSLRSARGAAHGVALLFAYRIRNQRVESVLDSAIDRNSEERFSGGTPKGSSSRRPEKRRRGDRHTSLRARSPTSIWRRTRPSDQVILAEARSSDSQPAEAGNVTSRSPEVSLSEQHPDYSIHEQRITCRDEI